MKEKVIMHHSAAGKFFNYEGGLWKATTHIRNLDAMPGGAGLCEFLAEKVSDKPLHIRELFVMNQ
jgi:hypothetical protein